MKKTLLTIGIGAGLMYLFDPKHGSERRAQLLDKIQGTLPKTAEAVTSKVSALGSKATDLTAHADDIAADAVSTIPPQLDAGSDGHTNATSADGAEVRDASEIAPAS